MRRRAAWLALAGIVAGLTGTPASAKPKRPPIRFASPAGIVAAEVQRSQLARSKGQWIAWRATAAEEAVLFVPQPVIARDWLKRQPNPAPLESRQPHQLWLSCDGSLAVAYGAVRQAGDRPGYFTTVWQRQKNGDYKWVMDESVPLAVPLPAPEMIGATIAACDRTRGSGPQAGPERKGMPSFAAPVLPAGARGGWSEDRTLNWTVQMAGDCGRTLSVGLASAPAKPRETVLEKRVAAPPPGSASAQGCAA